MFDYTLKSRRDSHGDWVRPSVRYVQLAGNHHPYLSFTADVIKGYVDAWRVDSYCGDRAMIASGTCHGEIRGAFPELAPYLGWHHADPDGPMHYIENGIYWGLKAAGLYRVFKGGDFEPAIRPDTFREHTRWGEVWFDTDEVLTHCTTPPEIVGCFPEETKIVQAAVLWDHIERTLKYRQTALQREFVGVLAKIEHIAKELS